MSVSGTPSGGAGADADAPVDVTLRRTPFGVAPDGTPVELYTLTNANGVEARIMTYGGIIVSLRVPDRDGQLADVVLGHDTLDGYLSNDAYLGALIGRYGNRIAHGRFALAGARYTLATNNGAHHLHGGDRGFDRKVWRAEGVHFPDGSAGVILRHTSPDGDEGYPGTVEVRVIYTLTPRDELTVEYHATTDSATPINLTQHSYFNLAGMGDVLDHELRLGASRYTPTGDGQIPTGEIAPVAGTPFDFRNATRIGDQLDADEPDLRRAGGYDHNFVLDESSGGLAHAAHLEEPVSGRVLDVYTTEPGVQFYSGNFLDGTVRGKGGQLLERRSGICLETQHFPDSPNQPAFPSTVLEPGAAFESRTVFAFSTRERR